MHMNWVTLRVRDMEKSLHFYSDHLKLDIAARFGSPERQIAMLGKENETKIELICEPGTWVEHPGNGVTIGLEADDLEALVSYLKEKGFAVKGPISPNPHITFYFVKDPDGYNIQLARQS